MITIQKALQEASKRLKRAGVATPRLDAEVLLAHSLGKAREEILLDFDKSLNQKEKNKFAKTLDRREKREPVALITGIKEFWSLSFMVNTDTLIPSPDSETLVKATLECVKGQTNLCILDLGTGSGCLLLAILSELQDAIGMGIDISQKALQCAKENAKRLGLTERTLFQQYDWMQNEPLSDKKFDVIVSNPPYIAAVDKKNLEPEVIIYGPGKALFAGKTGLEHIEQIIALTNNLLIPKGRLFLEVGEGQAEKVEKILKIQGHTDICRYQDLSGITRVLSACRD